MSKYTVKMKGIKKVKKKLAKIFLRSLRKIIKQATKDAVNNIGTMNMEFPPYSHVTLINELVKSGEIQTTDTDNGDGTYTHTFSVEDSQK